MGSLRNLSFSTAPPSLGGTYDGEITPAARGLDLYNRDSADQDQRVVPES